jgi:hypothetical protein
MNDDPSEQEIAARRDDGLRRALNTPPKPKEKRELGKPSPRPVSPKKDSQDRGDPQED